jgi:alpha-tubulin suppressor-like RCC1 family protein
MKISLRNCGVLALALVSVSITVAASANGTSVAPVVPGAVGGWGSNAHGQIGNNPGLPAAIDGLTQVVAIAGGNGHTLAARSDGSVWTIGGNFFGQLGRPDGVGDIHARGFSLAPIGGLDHVVAVAAGAIHSLALKSDGTVWAWGGGDRGQLGDGVTRCSACGQSTPTQVDGLSQITAIAAGTAHSLALSADGAVWTWGDNSSGQLGDGTRQNRSRPVRVYGVAGATAIAGGLFHSLVVAGGLVWSLGNNEYGQLGDRTIGATGFYGCCSADLFAQPVTGLVGVVGVAAGATHSLAVTADGTAWAWGQAHYGQLGNGIKDDWAKHPTPTSVSSISNVVAVASGANANHSLALTRDGAVWSWGDNWAGQLGDGTRDRSAVPVAVRGVTSHISMIAAGDYFSLALWSPGLAG